MTTIWDSLFATENDPSAAIIESDSTLIVLDTNTLLSIYRDAPERIEKMINFINTHKSRIFIPYIVAIEFGANFHAAKAELHKNTKDTIDKLMNLWKPILNVKSLKSILPSQIGSKSNVTSESFIGTVLTANQELIDDVSNAFNTTLHEAELTEMIKEKLQFIKKELEDSLEHREESFKELIKLITPLIGKRPEDDTIEKNEKIGQQRYNAKIGPGYNDSKKKKSRSYGITYQEKFGDLHIWSEILGYYREKSAYEHLVFITNDGTSEKKFDWLDKSDVNSPVPLIELKGELNMVRPSSMHILTLARTLQILETSTTNDDVDNEVYISIFDSKKTYITKPNSITHKNLNSINSDDELAELISSDYDFNEYLRNYVINNILENNFETNGLTGWGANPDISNTDVTVESVEFGFRHITVECSVEFSVDLTLTTNDPHNDNEEITEQHTEDLLLQGTLLASLPEYTLSDFNFTE